MRSSLQILQVGADSNLLNSNKKSIVIALPAEIYNAPL